jgi:predicted RNA-binding protein with PIN domain
MILIDGYNVAYKMGIKISKETLAHVRQTLEQKVIRYAAKQKRAVELIYDGRGVLGTSGTIGNDVRVVFTAGGETADTYIKSRIDALRAGGKTHALVVSSDMSIMDYARLSRICVVRSELFLNDLNSAASQPEDNSFQKTASLKTGAASFVAKSKLAKPTHVERKPTELSDSELDEWKKLFGE